MSLPCETPSGPFPHKRESSRVSAPSLAFPAQDSRGLCRVTLFSSSQGSRVAGTALAPVLLLRRRCLCAVKTPKAEGKARKEIGNLTFTETSLQNQQAVPAQSSGEAKKGTCGTGTERAFGTKRPPDLLGFCCHRCNSLLGRATRAERAALQCRAERRVQLGLGCKETVTDPSICGYLRTDLRHRTHSDAE